MTNKPIKIGDFLLRKKDIIVVQDEEKYKRITIRMNKLGVLQRDEVMGVDIGTKKQYMVQGGEFILSKIDSRNGAFGIVPASLKGAIITGDFLAYDINTDLVDMDFFLAFISLNNFEKICAKASSGTTNRQRLSEPKFLNFEIQIPETIGEQKEMMKKYFEIQKQFRELRNLSDKNEKMGKFLKSAILQDAIAGKLVPQDPSDESASVLIEKIQAEKSKLIAEGKIKKQKPLSPIKPEEIPYELPKGWEWVRLNNIFDVRDGTHDTPKYQDSGFPLITSKNIYNGKLDFSNIKYISKEDHENIIKRSKVSNGDILFAMIGSIGNPVLVDTDMDFSIKNVALIKYYSNELSNNKYLLYSLIYTQEIIKKMSSGAVQSFVPLNYLREYLFPLPPLQEQKRIVDKIDELMKSCEFLDEQVKQAKERSEKLMESVLQGVFNG